MAFTASPTYKLLRPRPHSSLTRSLFRKPTNVPGMTSGSLSVSRPSLLAPHLPKGRVYAKLPTGIKRWASCINSRNLCYRNLEIHELFIGCLRLHPWRLGDGCAGTLGRSETEDPRANPSTSDIVQHDFHLRKSGVTRPGLEPGSPWWEASIFSRYILVTGSCCVPSVYSTVQTPAYLATLHHTPLTRMSQERYEEYMCKLEQRLQLTQTRQWHVMKCCKVSWCLLTTVHSLCTQQEPVTTVQPRETECIPTTHKRTARDPLHASYGVTCRATSVVVTQLESRRVTSCGYNSSHPVWHALYECLQDIHGDSSPFLLQPFHELSNGFWPHLTSPHPAIQFVPKMFYRVEVGALGGPWLDYLPPNKADRVRFPAGSLPDFRMWELYRTMQLIEGFSQGSPLSPIPLIPTLLHSQLAPSPSALKTSISARLASSERSLQQRRCHACIAARGGDASSIACDVAIVRPLTQQHVIHAIRDRRCGTTTPRWPSWITSRQNLLLCHSSSAANI
ncbi:hypothetical protein PR048_014988 [Dryococelus australis]|uniref:Uncharacterized protein n=1 Tax=Dryococelus australis TaxID=614101 RepID=A0ABQ9HGK6_9NEOP|nr:hypothetical protein PR048_014988 [Dryococelus australis]